MHTATRMCTCTVSFMLLCFLHLYLYLIKFEALRSITMAQTRGEKSNFFWTLRWSEQRLLVEFLLEPSAGRESSISEMKAGRYSRRCATVSSWRLGGGLSIKHTDMQTEITHTQKHTSKRVPGIVTCRVAFHISFKSNRDYRLSL